jgi:hypothetical protein
MRAIIAGKNILVLKLLIDVHGSTVAFRHRTVPRGTARHRAVNFMQIYANLGFNVCMHLVKNGG